MAEAPVVSVVGRWDYVIIDAAALVAHGRAAYLHHYPEDTAEDAELVVQDPTNAVMEIHPGAPPAQLEGIPGLDSAMPSGVRYIRHAGTDQVEVVQDPFGILAGSSADAQDDAQQLGDDGQHA